ncbi:hypothetical protein V8G54_022679 [Vigna mungo]|uniref:Uncharacterized protein n=1 Tax=Vigna mungo TaxID=3915 RepID=A0AAQ3N3V9_VIGMU
MFGFASFSVSRETDQLSQDVPKLSKSPPFLHKPTNTKKQNELFPPCETQTIVGEKVKEPQHRSEEENKTLREENPKDEKDIKCVQHRLRGNRGNRGYQNGFWNVQFQRMCACGRTYCLGPWANQSIKSLQHRLRGNRSNRGYQSGFWNVRTASILSSNRDSIPIRHQFSMNRGIPTTSTKREPRQYRLPKWILEHPVSVDKMSDSDRTYCLGSEQQ